MRSLGAPENKWCAVFKYEQSKCVAPQLNSKMSSQAGTKISEMSLGTWSTARFPKTIQVVAIRLNLAQTHGKHIDANREKTSRLLRKIATSPLTRKSEVQLSLVQQTWSKCVATPSALIERFSIAL